MNGEDAMDAATGRDLADMTLESAADPGDAPPDAPAEPGEAPCGALAEAGDDRHQRLIRQFEQWLDRMEQGEPPPEGLPAEILAEAAESPDEALDPQADLYSLFVSLTALTGEIRFQARGFKQLTDALAPFAQLPGRLDRVEAGQNLIVEELARQSTDEANDSAMPSAKDVLAVVFDMHERLERGLRTFDSSIDALRQPSAGWMKRLFGGTANEKPLAAADAMREGYRLALSRLEASLAQWSIERAGARGEMFDPSTMAAVDVQSVSNAPDGTVLEVYRSGYQLHGRMLATAQVKVAKNAAARE